MTINVLFYAALILLIVFLLGNGKSNSENFDPGHCPPYCTPFLYPDMYHPRGNCSDPFSWGFTYSTGRCPRVYKPIPRRLPTK